MKALVLSGGKGTRLRPLTFTCAKQLIPVANKPILGYVLDQVAATSITEVGIITAPETGHFVEAYVADGSSWNLDVQYIPQQPLGLAHAVKTAKEFLGSDPFVMCLGDNITGQGLAGFIEKFIAEGLDALIILKEVETPSSFGIAQLDKVGNIVQLVEKPKIPMGNLAIIGTYLFSSRIHEAIERIVPSWRGELEITDAIQEMIHMGFTVKAELLDSWWLDTGKKDDILSANAIILDECVSYDVKGKVVDSTLVGRVRVEADTEIINSVVRGPCVIGKNVLVEGSFIGPYTSIGDNSKICNSNLEYCVVHDGVTIQDVERLEDSLIGKNAKVTRNPRNRTLKLHVGDYSELEV
ncbi:glucose-1-phosphate thymidylyltransferase [Candidatus Bathycorpusculum sp.]|uniref:glucose-1-phosphate thymidylyltransferase n=1 Tax=Candidatus Bathycorpusculum sp. TaxID=2994959 RepID=UPI002825BB5B|nr:glucose-1-phosphate thymidylyltransferase [Candidatus Termitimicrobium sp.]MCL2685487.1 glucose-1-phosphate thymidylyltransferase [Candidatus Termitimicrobium sp.]